MIGLDLKPMSTILSCGHLQNSNILRPSKKGMCTACYQKRWRKRHPGKAAQYSSIWNGKPENKEAVREYKLNWYHSQTPEERIARTYGMTPKMLKQLKKIQNSRCAICEKKPKKLIVDHDHKAGRTKWTSGRKGARGLLCYGCNNALGWLEKIPTFADKAEQYLTHPPVQQMKERTI